MNSLSPNKSTTFCVTKWFKLNKNFGVMSNMYSRRECLEIVGISETVSSNSLEEIALNIFEELCVRIILSDIEAQLRVGPSSCKNVIIKMSRLKDANTVLCVKRNPSSMKLEALEVGNPIFSNDSLCSCYIGLCSKCKRLWTNKNIHTFWVSNVSVKMKVRENSKPNIIGHNTDLEKIFLRMSSSTTKPESNQ